MQNHHLGEHGSIFFQPPRLGAYSCWDDIWEIPKGFGKYIGRVSPTTRVSILSKKGMMFFFGKDLHLGSDAIGVGVLDS